MTLKSAKILASRRGVLAGLGERLHGGEN